MRRTILYVLALSCSLVVGGQERLRIMEWNVENLFDCQHDTLMNDYDFLPTGKMQWTESRYWRKQQDIARVVLAVGGDKPVDLVGLAEVENDTCMRDLTERSLLRTLGYRYVMTEGSDPRGVDVALMYLPFRFRLLGSESKRVPSRERGLYPTRDILHAWGVLVNGDTLHVAVCHFPSRARGRSSDKNRLLAAQTVAALADSLGSDCRLLVMGDFNAPPSDPVFKAIGDRLLDLAPKTRHPKEGTYYYQGEWSWIDHILVSPPLKEKVPVLRLYTAPWMQDANSNGGWHPRRTFLGTYYHGGVSDHVPIFCDMLLHDRPLDGTEF